MRKYPRLWADLAGGSGHGALDRDHAFACEFLEEFQDRVVFGRDYFDTPHLELLRSLGLAEGILEKVVGGNALRLVPEERG
jgi:predicted TIM-barrel fold metal-dependent hydrolase